MDLENKAMTCGLPLGLKTAWAGALRLQTVDFLLVERKYMQNHKAQKASKGKRLV